MIVYASIGAVKNIFKEMRGEPGWYPLSLGANSTCAAKSVRIFLRMDFSRWCTLAGAVILVNEAAH